MKARSDDAERIKRSSAINESTGCWEWSLSRQRNGYGQIKYGGKMRRAHRVSFEAFNGPIPYGMEVMHKCDNRGCVNPDHLSIGTHRENMLDIDAKGRRLKGKSHPLHGRPGRAGSLSRQSKPVEIDGIAYGSMKEAERVIGVSGGSVRYWLKTGKARFVGAN